jgi:anti-sigma28 factor (negative regulator of flagellin synthesis)
MQLSDREIQNTLDLLKKQKVVDEDEAASLSIEEIAEVNEVIKHLGGAPEVRSDKVEKLKKALESSSYNVTNDDVAKKLIGRIFSDKIR